MAISLLFKIIYNHDYYLGLFVKMIVFTNKYNRIGLIYIPMNLLKLIKNFQLYLVTEMLFQIMKLNDYIQIDNPFYCLVVIESSVSIEKIN